ncbi:adenosylcobalamin-dependent ribonucleoside-diphosphate reductase [Pelomicrobium sp. G1]|uniref:adenosylcobalamin-dependent ribonucleoside-diphosphate reductase n=1 Tax=unclassified Pelomicrobium TaxID=2815318 RepID=UPI003F76CB98
MGFLTQASRHVWETKYRYRDGANGGDHTIEDTWRRVARTLGAVEWRDREAWTRRFLDILEDFKFLPGGRILAGAGTGRNVTLFNCFVMGTIEDSMEGIFRALHEGAVTMQQGGGVGYDFSTLRPRGTRAKGVGAIASGPVSFMGLWDAMCATLLSTGARRGAMMATLRCDHPDIEEFVSAKRKPGALRHFNLSVLVTDAFIEAVRLGRDWPLVFPATAADEPGGETVLRDWPGHDEPVRCRVHRTLKARDLWAMILRATYDYAEPGVLFIDRINRQNNLRYRERISATNPCGEVPLPPYGACDLGSVNLTAFVREPFTDRAHLDTEGIRETATVAARLMDNVIDASQFPLAQQAEQARGTRRIGLGITGLADTLIMLNLHYAEPEARALAAEVMRLICHSAYRNSIELAQEKGPFPFFERGQYLHGEFIRSLPADIRDGIARHGIRNSHLIAVAPTGTISLLAGNVSSGLEPAFAAEFRRSMLHEDGTTSAFELVDYAVALWRRLTGDRKGLPPAFVRASDVPPDGHVAMQAALQPFVDNSISKTIAVPEDFPFDAFQNIYDLAYDRGLKGCTTYRPNPVRGVVVTAAEESTAAPHCCAIEREAD